jgi:HPt (histidine-containing phosphotransfer) domain-containing protein
MREMFLANGFSDYLAKPIEMNKLDEIMARWIPMNKRVKRLDRESAYTNGSFSVPIPENSKTVASAAKMEIVPIDGVDVRQGMENTNSFSWNSYRDVLALYCQDATTRLEVIRTVPVDGDPNGLASLANQFRAIKSASASIGAADLAKQAGALEDAAKQNDPAFVRQELSVFRTELEALTSRIQTIIHGE